MSDKKEPQEENKKTCFVIMPISDVEGYEKGHFNRVYEYIIKPACRNAGFEPVRADDTSKANVIIVDILQQVLKADMAICDISARNANVFYELGFRQAFNKKTVLIKDNKTVMPFDIYGIRTISYESSLRIDEVYKSTNEIRKALMETEKAGNKEINSLVSLLSIKEATIPDVHSISFDTSIILNSINGIKEKFANSINNSPIFYDISNRNVNINLKIGDVVSYFRKYEENGKYRNDVGIGKIIDNMDDNYYLISNNKNNIMERINKNLIIRTL